MYLPLPRLSAQARAARHFLQTIPGQTAWLGLFIGFVFFLKTLYLWAPQYDLQWRIENLRVLVVDYDRGLLGLQLNSTYDSLRGPSFPEFVFVDSADYHTEDEIYRAVTRQDYWGAIYIRPDATSRLLAVPAIDGDAGKRSSRGLVVYTWNEASYPMVAYWIKTALRDAAERLRLGFLLSSAVMAALTLPNQVPTSDEIQSRLSGISDMLQALEKPACDGKALGETAFNNLAIMTLVIGIDAFLQLFKTTVISKTSLRAPRLFLLYYTAGAIYSFWLGLALTTSPWLVKGRAGSRLQARDFLLSWLGLWAGGFVLFSVSCLIRTWCRNPMTSRSLPILWMAINAASAFVPIEISPGIFKWNWAVPGHAIYRILVSTWCGAGSWQVAIGAAVLACWFSLGALGTWLALGRQEQAREKRQPSRPHSGGNNDSQIQPR